MITLDKHKVYCFGDPELESVISIIRGKGVRISWSSPNICRDTKAVIGYSCANRDEIGYSYNRDWFKDHGYRKVTLDQFKRIWLDQDIEITYKNAYVKDCPRDILINIKKLGFAKLNVPLGLGGIFVGYSNATHGILTIGWTETSDYWIDHGYYEVTPNEFLELWKGTNQKIDQPICLDGESENIKIDFKDYIDIEKLCYKEDISNFKNVSFKIEEIVININKSNNFKIII